MEGSDKVNSIAATAQGAGEARVPEESVGLDIKDHFDVTRIETIGEPFVEDPKMSARGVNVFYADKQAIHDVSLDIGSNEVISPPWTCS